jgi:peroxiredoxin/Tfp pilus assembly protein PilF
METTRFGLRKQATGWLRLSGIGLAIGLLVTLGAVGSFREPVTRAQGNDTAYEEEVLKGRDLLRRHRYEDALKSFKRANDMRDKKSAECFLLLAEAYEGLGAHKNVADSCDKVVELAGNDNQLRAEAYNLKGIALQASSESKDQKKLQEAEAAFRQGVALNSGVPNLHYNLGVVLLQEGRDPDGVAELKKYVELQPGSANTEPARRMIENPRRARENYAPDFSITTSEGEYIALDDLRGKVVLLDFWGTWCPPCVESVPSLRDMYKRYAKEKSFVMISVSVHDEEDKWRAFTAKNQMAWFQHFDRESKVARAFSVNRFPTYVLIDHEGIVRFRVSGMSFEREAALNDAIHKQIKIVAKTAPSD